MNVISRLRDSFFPPHQPIPAGMYHQSATSEAGSPYRLHLRVEPDGLGILIVNGSIVLHLNPTATEYVFHLVNGSSIEETSRSVSRRYGISIVQATADFQNVVDKIHTLVETPDLDPVAYLDMERAEPYSAALSAPYRLDCALTYRTPEAGAASYAPVERVKRDLLQAEWQTILDKAWNAGIPQVVFTGGEPTLRPDLVDLIAYASRLGMVTGLISNGLRLAETGYLHAVLQSGLDHLMLILDPAEEQSWEALRDTLAEDLAVTVHLTLTPKATFEDGAILDRLVQMGVKSISLSASEVGLSDKIPVVRQLAANRFLKLVWDLPVPYSSLHISVRAPDTSPGCWRPGAGPVALELAGSETSPAGAGNAWLYVEPDGDVLLAQGEPDVLGNLLTDSWETIWNRRG